LKKICAHAGDKLAKWRKYGNFEISSKTMDNILGVAPGIMQCIGIVKKLYNVL
jgi:hypothetical protein